MPEASACPAIMHGTKISAKAPRAMMGLIRRKRADLATSPDHSSSVTMVPSPSAVTAAATAVQ